MKKLMLAGILALSGASLTTIAFASGDGHAKNDAHAGHGGAAHASADQPAAGHDMPGGHHMPQHQALDWDSAKVSDTIAVTECWIRSIPAPAPSGGYFVVHNKGQDAIKLIGAASPAYGMVMLHQTTQHEGMSRMSEAEDITIASGGTLAFKPGGYHAMLEQAAKAPAIGSQVTLDFLFDNGKKASAQCEVKPANTLVR
ncbi:copper chaperone PCu(A)C [Allopusillimonas ginsengisoli]|uniref:copper chaperone PCu(A)C n=1 Tax=Allopusillimonas ginsengisoli TaxID=453575 RepID=UPI001020D0DB|nr:copper chaperone PCu(A)C [Allopusillimonas ginsengisoli]TEA78185.1 copper chaperone PCu(A)C [Allopusillimonas ginsengisoli]